MFKCNACNFQKKNLFFKCPKCNSVDIDEVSESQASAAKQKAGMKSRAAFDSSSLKAPVKISEAKKASRKRIATGIGELDRVLGGGFVEKEVALFAATPGTGKSTLSMQIAGSFAENLGKTVIYFSGEETEEQVADRANRLGVTSDKISIIHTSNLDEILSYIASYKPDFFVVDSIQMVATESISGSMGSIAQSKEAANALTSIAKSVGSIAVLISQVNKGEEFAGSMFVQHVVDCLLFFEGSNDSPLKFLRTFKNRYGSTDEVGIFQHEENGLKEVKDPTGIFLESGENSEAVGSSFTVISEGRRSLIAEVQALTVPATSSRPRQQINNLDYNRALLVSAVLDKYLKKGLSTQDLFVSTSNGVKVYEPGSDLALAVSILSSLSEKPLKKKAVFIGEISLSGYIRANNSVSQKVSEAARMGMEIAVIPKGYKSKINIGNSNLKIIEIGSITELPGILSKYIF